MDIQLSDGLSFEIFKEIKSVTPIIFITAYDKYALEAFEVKGVDYILKPFDKINSLLNLEVSTPWSSANLSRLL